MAHKNGRMARTHITMVSRPCSKCGRWTNNVQKNCSDCMAKAKKKGKQ